MSALVEEAVNDSCFCINVFLIAPFTLKHDVALHDRYLDRTQSVKM